MKTLGYYNGTYGEIDEMVVPMNDRVSWFGDGVYDAGPCHNYVIFALDEHIDRFFNSASMLDIQIPMSKQELADLLNDLVRKMDTGDLFVYYQCTRGTALRNHAYEPGPGNLWVMLKPAGIHDGVEPVTLITMPDTRFFHCNIKTLNLIPSVMASQKAKQEGAAETVFYRPGNEVTECAHSNVHILKDGVLRTHPCDNLILPGIARKHIIKACNKLGIPVDETPFTLDELFAADEVMVSSSSNLCLRTTEIDHKPVGGKALDLYESIRVEVMREFYAATEVAE